MGDGKYSIDKDRNAELLSLLINSLYGIDKNGNATLNSVLMGSLSIWLKVSDCIKTLLVTGA